MISSYLETTAIPALSKQMRCGMFSMPHGAIMIIHDKEMDAAVDWVEYNSVYETMSIIRSNGTTQPLGLDIDEQTKKNLKNGVEIMFARVHKQQIHEAVKVSLVLQEY